MGINFFALNDLFQTADRRQDISYDVRVQMVGIYNEEIQDLLAEDPASNGESSHQNVILRSVKSSIDAINLVKCGERTHMGVNTLKMNNLNSHSHRSVGASKLA